MVLKSCVLHHVSCRCVVDFLLVNKTLIHKAFPKRKILGSPKLKEFADVNFKFDEKWQQVFQSDRKGNTVGKGEISPNE